MQDNVITKTSEVKSLLVQACRGVSRYTDMKLLDLVIRSGYLEVAIIKYFNGTTAHKDTIVDKMPYVFNLFASLGYSPTTRSVSYSQTLAHTRVLNTAIVFGVLFSKTSNQKVHAQDIKSGAVLVGPSSLQEEPSSDLVIKTKFLELKYSSSTGMFQLTPKTSRGKFAASKEIENV